MDGRHGVRIGDDVQNRSRALLPIGAGAEWGDAAAVNRATREFRCIDGSEASARWRFGIMRAPPKYCYGNCAEIHE